MAPSVDPAIGPSATGAAVERAAAVLGGRGQRGVPLGSRTTYRVGGAAALLLDAAGPGDLVLARRAVRASGVPVLVLGRGSNLLVADAGFPGLVVALGAGFDAIVPDAAAGRVRAGGGASLPVLARRTAAAGLGGLEWTVGVPGSVGGAVRMNAGGHGSDVAAVLVRAGICDLTVDPPGGRSGEGAPIEVVDASALGLGYRRSAVAPGQVVVWAEFAVEPRDPAAAEAEVAEVVAWRRANQPGGFVKTDPPGDSAGRLIDAAGLKGLRRGSAAVSDRHANFVQADPGGSADDVAALAREVQRRVEDATGVRLELELRLVGFADPAGEREGRR